MKAEIDKAVELISQTMDKVFIDIQGKEGEYKEN